MTGVPGKPVGDAGFLQFRIDAGAITESLRRAPRVAYYWLRDFLFRAFVQHRVSWLKSKRTQFGRGGQGIKVWKVNEGPSVAGPKDVIYRVEPAQRRAKTSAEASELLQHLQAEGFTGNFVLPIHEFGTDIRSSGLMALRAKSTQNRGRRPRERTPAEFRSKHPDAKLLALPSKRGGGAVLLYEVERVKGRGRPRKDGKGPMTRERLILRYLLTRFVDMKPTLRFYDSWQDLEQQRAQLWTKTATKIEKDLERGVDP